MPFHPPDISERTWLGTFIAVGGLLCGIVAVAALIWQEPIILLAVAAGSGWTLSIVTVALYNGQRRRQIELETDLEEARRQAGEWSATSNNIARAAHAVIELAGSPPTPPVRRRRPRGEQGE